MKRIFLSRTGITSVTLGNGMLFGFYLGAYYADREPWMLLGLLGFGTGLAGGLIMLFQKSRWGDDGIYRSCRWW